MFSPVRNFSLLIILSLTTALLLLPTTTLRSVSAALQQTKDRVAKRYNWPNEPAAITGLKIKGKHIRLGQTFSDRDDWLRGLVVKVKNVSDKAIVFLEVTLKFPRSGSSPEELPSSSSLTYGQFPPPPGETATPSQQPPLKPGEKLELAIDDYQSLRQFLDDTGKAASLKEVEVSLGDIIFDDGTMWSAGQILQRDPTNPEKWNVVSSPTITQVKKKS